MHTSARALLSGTLTIVAVLGGGAAVAADEAPPTGIFTCTPSVSAYVTAPGADSVSVQAAGDSSLLCLPFSVAVGVTDVTVGQGLYSGTMGATRSFNATFNVPRGHTVVITAQQHYTQVQDSATPAAVAPSPVGSLVASEATQTTMTLDWTVPSSDGGSPITGYTVTWNGGSTSAPATEVVVSGLAPATTYTFAVAASNGAGSSVPTTVTATTSARPTPPGPAPSPQPAPITPVTIPVPGGGNVDGSLDTDSTSRTIQQTMAGTWPKQSVLISGKRLTLGRLADLRTNAGQQAVMSVTYLSPSIRSANVTIDGRGRVVAVTATLRDGARSGAVVLTVSAAPMRSGDVGYEGIQASRRFSVRRA